MSNYTMNIVVDRDKCDGCKICIDTCPTDTLEMLYGKAGCIDDSECVSCGACIAACPQEAIDWGKRLA